jgi:peptide-methionine (S)-S-oxide reductase
MLQFFRLSINLCAVVFALISCGNTSQAPKNININSINNKMESKNLDTTTLGTGCFWCTEAIFMQLKGVEKVTSGYSGGHVENPTYEEVCDKTTGHAECLQIIYDTTVISFDELLEVFWQSHNPTTLNKQGGDEGPQYRSVIFYHNATQKAIAEKYIDELNKSGAYDAPIVTTLEAMTKFYAAESYHQNYYNQNKSAGYCQFVIQPKVDKFRKVFASKLKQ